jgi:hypothetical protein
MNYKPNRWLMVKIDTIYKIFATWGGGYTDGDSWQLNSGVKSVTQDDDYYYFHGHSGSVYECRKGSYGTTGYGAGVLSGFMKKYPMEILPDNVKVMEIEYSKENNEQF